MQMERNTIIEFLKADPEMDFNPSAMNLQDLIDLMIDKMNDMELDYSILSTAFMSKVNPARFDEFYDAVMDQYEMMRDGEEIPEQILDRLAAQYR